MPCIHGVFGYCVMCNPFPQSYTPFVKNILVLTCSTCRRFFAHELTGWWQDEPLPTECAACVRAREEKQTAMLKSLTVEEVKP